MVGLIIGECGCIDRRDEELVEGKKLFHGREMGRSRRNLASSLLQKIGNRLQLAGTNEALGESGQ